MISAKVWFIDHWVTFQLTIGIYQNIITFLNANNLSFLTTMELDFSTIPLILHGRGNSKTLLDYLANNTSDNALVAQFLNYFLNVITTVSYSNGQLLNFRLSEDAGWQDMTMEAYEPFTPTTTTTTTAILGDFLLTKDLMFNVVTKLGDYITV